MRKHLTFTLFIYVSTLVQSQDLSTMPRFTQQQMFIHKMLQKANLPPVHTPADLDSCITIVRNSWFRFVEDSLSGKTPYSTDVLKSLDSYSYLFMTPALSKATGFTGELEKHVYLQYMLPAMEADQRLVSSDPANQKLIWIGSLNNVLWLGCKYYEDAAAFKNFRSTIMKLREGLTAVSNNTEDDKKNAARMIRLIDGYRDELEAKNQYYQSGFDQAFTYLLTGMYAGNFNYRTAVPFARKLMDVFNEKKESAKSLTILANLYLFTTNDELPKDTIESWYVKTDSVNGSKLFAEMKKRTGKAYQAAATAGINLPKEWRFVANSIPADKLKKAKYLLVDFWYTACVPCIKEFPELMALQEKLKTRDDIIFLSINTDYFNTKESESFVKEAIRKHKSNFPVVYDRPELNLAKQLKVEGYPAKFILTPDGLQITKVGSSQITLATFHDFIKESSGF